MTSGSDNKIREKVNAVGEVPGSMFDKEGAWQKLQMRIDTKPAVSYKKKHYGVAAALVLILISITVLISRREKQVAYVSTAKVNTPEYVAAIPEISQQVEQSKVVEPPVVVKPRAMQGELQVVENPPPAIVQDVDIAPAMTDTLVLPVETVVQVTYKKQKIKVVHISDVAEETPQHVPPPRNNIMTIAHYRSGYKSDNRSTARTADVPGGWFK